MAIQASKISYRTSDSEEGEGVFYMGQFCGVLTEESGSWIGRRDGVTVATDKDKTKVAVALAETVIVQ